MGHRRSAGLPFAATLVMLPLMSGCDSETGGGDAMRVADADAVGNAVVNGPSGLRLCNMTSSRVGVAIGYMDDKGWTTEGWWNVASHNCETLLRGSLIARYYYVHAIDYDRGGEWAGRAFMCTDDKAFTIIGVEECTNRGYRSTGFFEIDTGEERGWTVRLTDPADSEAVPEPEANEETEPQ